MDDLPIASLAAGGWFLLSPFAWRKLGIRVSQKFINERKMMILRIGIVAGLALSACVSHGQPEDCDGFDSSHVAQASVVLSIFDKSIVEDANGFVDSSLVDLAIEREAKALSCASDAKIEVWQKAIDLAESGSLSLEGLNELASLARGIEERDADIYSDIRRESVLDAIAGAESSWRCNPPDGAAGERGMYQMMEGTWNDRTDIPWSQARHPETARYVAGLHLDWIVETLSDWTGDEVAYDDELVFAVWNRGIGYARNNFYEVSRMATPAKVYAGRVGLLTKIIKSHREIEQAEKDAKSIEGISERFAK